MEVDGVLEGDATLLEEEHIGGDRSRSISMCRIGWNGGTFSGEERATESGSVI